MSLLSAAFSLLLFSIKESVVCDIFSGSVRVINHFCVLVFGCSSPRYRSREEYRRKLRDENGEWEWRMFCFFVSTLHLKTWDGMDGGWREKAVWYGVELGGKNRCMDGYETTD